MSVDRRASGRRAQSSGRARALGTRGGHVSPAAADGRGRDARQGHRARSCPPSRLRHHISSSRRPRRRAPPRRQRSRPRPRESLPAFQRSSSRSRSVPCRWPRPSDRRSSWRVPCISREKFALHGRDTLRRFTPCAPADRRGGVMFRFVLVLAVTTAGLIGPRAAAAQDGMLGSCKSTIRPQGQTPEPDHRSSRSAWRAPLHVRRHASGHHLRRHGAAGADDHLRNRHAGHPRHGRSAAAAARPPRLRRARRDEQPDQARRLLRSQRHRAHRRRAG